MAQDLIGAGCTWLTAQLVDNASVAAIYSRDGDTITLRVVPGQSTHTLSDDGGVRVLEWEDDFLLAVTDLRLSMGTTVPKLGDRIMVATGGKAGTYELLEPAAGIQVAERANGGTMWRCHAKRLKDPTP